ncbi:MAG: hypothetical protein KatS3mg068_0777 [Candidatus Sericytochromatia bacterium]|nr:MAG: hypothetical protein KatS3mg068_0777 [Candidatus Sericytochromatia bacterium]
MEVSTFLKKCISIVEKINKKLFGSLRKKKDTEVIESEKYRRK